MVVAKRRLVFDDSRPPPGQEDTVVLWSDVKAYVSGVIQALERGEILERLEFNVAWLPAADQLCVRSGVYDTPGVRNILTWLYLKERGVG